MEKRLSSLAFAFCRLLLLLLIPIFSTTSDAQIQQPAKRRVSLFIFGDSFLDAGNNNYINTSEQANYWPYGETYFNYPTGRFSDGRIIPDFIAEYAKLPLIPPYLQPRGFDDQDFFGVNFASSSAGVLVETFQEDHIIGLRTQLKYYKEVTECLEHKLGYNEAKRTISEAVYMFSVGVNDYTIPFVLNNSNLSHFALFEMVIGNLTEIIQDIYNLGARKFVFINLPPLGCLPSMRGRVADGNGGCLKEASNLTSLHNNALSNLLHQMEMQLFDFRYSVFDFESGLQWRLNHPSKYGFKEEKTACCGIGLFRGIYSCGGKRKRFMEKFELCEDPNEFLFWDSFHLTEKAYRQLADEMWTHQLANFFTIVNHSS